MKILYIANERSDAQVAATALHTIAPDVTVSWASDFDSAAFWIRENQDLAALIMEVNVDSQDCLFLKYVRQLGLNAPVVVIPPDGVGSPLEWLNAGADDHVAKNHSLSSALPVVVMRAIERAETLGTGRWDHLRQAHQTSGHASDSQQSLDPVALESRLADLEALLDQRELIWALERSAAAERQAKLEELIDQERALRTSLEQSLAQSKSANQDVEQRHIAATTKAAEQLAERQAQYEIGMARAAATWEVVDEQLRESTLEVERAQQSHASAAAEVDRLSRRESELVSQLAEATATRDTFTGRLADAEAALATVNEHMARDRSAATEQAAVRQTEFQAQLEQEVEKRHRVEEDLARAGTARDDAAALLAEGQAQFDAKSAEAAAARHALERQVSDLEAALDRDRQTLESDTATVERLTGRESELTSMLAEAAAARNTLERRLAATEAAFKDSDERATRDRLAATKKAAERQTELDEVIRQERAARTDVEQKLAQVEASLRETEQRHASAMTTAATGLAECQAQFEAELSQTAEARDDLRQQLSDVEAGLAEARNDHALAAAEVERLAHRETELASQLANAASARTALELQLTEAANALKDGEERATRDGLAATQSAAERQAELDELIRQERATRTSVEQKLAQVEAALRESEQSHASAMTTAATGLAECQAQFETELSQTAAARDDLRQQLSDVEVALDASRRDHALAATEVERLAHCETELASQLANAATARTALELQLTDAANALKDADERATRDRLAATQKATERQTELDEVIRQERAARTDVEQKLAQVEASLRETEQRHASAMTTAATGLAECQAQFEAELSQTAEARDDLRQQLSGVEVALDASRRDHALAATEVERLSHRETELASQLANAATARTALELQLTDAANALKDADERATRDRLAAAQRAAERQAELDELIRQERATRTSVEQKLAQVEAALRESEQSHASAMTTAATGLAECQAQFEAELSQTAAARDDLRQRLSDVEVALEASRRDHALAATEVERLAHRETELASQLANAAAAHAALERQLTDTGNALKGADERANQERLTATTRQWDLETRLAQHVKDREALERRFCEEREGLERARLAAEADVRRLVAERTEDQRNLEEIRKDFQRTLDRVSSEHASALARLAASVTERDAQIQEQTARHSASLKSAERDRSRLQDDFQTSLAARAREIEQIQNTLKSTIQELVSARRRCDVLQTEADRVPQLQTQLDDSRAETRGQFQHSPLALCRCTRDGALVHANRAFAALIGYRKPDDIRGADFAATVFESPNDLSWLIERSLSTKARESVETTWKRSNGDRFVVRLSAFASASDLIEIAAEDLTNLRALEERLRRAQRMEAVGRLASEVAVTCGNLLKDVHQDAQQWLISVSGDAAPSPRGEMLLEELSRAARLLRQLAAYGDEQTNALAPVDVNRVLRDLKPVLKQLAGDDVALELPKASSPLNVDVQADRVERVLVNIASYGRERMPFGGRLRIELGTVFVDRKFIERYPNVRQGHHALITVTEVSRAMRADPKPQGVASEKLGVDLGALQELIGECGGHLWMTVEPPGNMVVKIRLPLRASDDQAHPPKSDTETSRGSTTARWLRH